MNKSTEILMELSAISPELAALDVPVPFEVPEGYFESFPAAMLSFILNESSGDQAEIIPSWLQKEIAMPFSVPGGYFETLAGDLLNKIRQEEESPKEELKSISPFLAGISKTNPFTLPENYFESLQPDIKGKTKSEPAKIFVLGTWKRIAAAAIFAGIILSTVVFYLNYTTVSPGAGSTVSVSDKALEDFLSNDNLEILPEPLNEDDGNTMALLDINENTIREVLQTVDDKAIREYMSENPDADVSDKMN